MIDSIFLGDIQLDTDKRVLSAIRNLTFPFIQYSAIRKAGFSGQSVNPSEFASYKFALEFTVVGDDFSDLANERAAFVGTLGEIISSGEKTLKINRTSEIDVQIDIKGIDIDSDLDARNPVTSVFRLEMEAEYPYLQGQELKSQTIEIFNGGGMEIPMAIPMDMSIGGENEVILTNDGNAEAFPFFEFRGNLNTPSLRNVTTGKVFNLNNSLATASDKIIVDTFLRTVVLQPANTNRRRFASGQFWTLATGDNVVRLSSAGGSGVCIVTWRDHFYGL